MPDPSHSDSLPARLRPAARRLLRLSLADDIPDFADGKLDGDPELKALVEEVVRTDLEASRLLAEYVQLRDALPKTDTVALANRILARVPAPAPAKVDAESFPALVREEPPAEWLANARERLRQWVASSARGASAAGQWAQEEVALVGGGLMALLGMRPAHSAVRDRSSAASAGTVIERDPFEASRAILAERLESRHEVRVTFANAECEVQFRRDRRGDANLCARPHGALTWSPFALIVQRASGESETFASEGQVLSLACLSDFPADLTTIEIHFA